MSSRRSRQAFLWTLLYLFFERLSWRGAALLLSVVVIQTLAAEQSPFGRADEPFLAIRVIARFADRIIGNDVEDEVVGTIVDKLMRFTRREDKRVACFDHCPSALVPRHASAGNNVVE